MALVPPPQEGTVAVMVRVRPPAAGERAAQHPLLRVVDHNTLVFDPEGVGGASSSVLPARGTKNPGKHQKFVFDRVFGERATQEEVFQHTTREMVDTVLSGYNCSVFAYGATGAGKTFTMLGSEQSPGIIYLTMVELYKQMEARKQKSYEVLVSYQEVYNEQIHDLLEPKGPLSIREDPEKGAVVQGLSFHQPTSAEQLLQMVVSGNKNRTQHPTDANASSSRSHAVFQVYVKQQARAGGLGGDVQVAKMSLVDLAGSERASVANTRGDRLREGANINRSLLALIGVITALAGAKGKRSHIPYRDSKLTRLLKDCIGGNCRTLMLAALSPSPLAYEDTYNTLKYASRAKEIKVSLKSNLPSKDSHVCKYTELCEQLRAEVAELRAKLRAYEDAARESQCRGPVLLPALTLSPLDLPRAVSPARSHDLNVTYEVYRLPASPSRPLGCSVQEAPTLEHSQSLLDKEEDAPSVPKAAAPAMSFIPTQQPLHKDGSFLAQDVAPEALEAVAQQEAAASQEQVTATEVSRASPAQRSQQGCDGEDPAEASVAVPAAPVISSHLPGWQHLAPLTNGTVLALSPIRKRRRSAETPASSQLASPCCLSPRLKRQRRSGKQAEAARAAQSLDSPCLPAAAPAPSGSLPPPSCTSSLCLGPVTESCVPLLSAEGGCALPVPSGHNLNATYEIFKAVAPARSHDLNVTNEVCQMPATGSEPGPLGCSMPEGPALEHSQSLLGKQEDVPSVPKTCKMACGTEAPSLSKLSVVSRASALKQKAEERATCPTLGGHRSCIPQPWSGRQRAAKSSVCQPRKIVRAL